MPLTKRADFPQRRSTRPFGDRVRGIPMDDDESLPLIIALDTNVLVQSLPGGGRFRAIMNSFITGRVHLVVSTEILLKNQEVLDEISGRNAGTVLQELLANYQVHVVKVEPTFRGNAILDDPDDNKFVDAAVTANAHWIVTEDGHFDVLEHNTLLTIRPMTPHRLIDRHL